MSLEDTIHNQRVKQKMEGLRFGWDQAGGGTREPSGSRVGCVHLLLQLPGTWCVCVLSYVRARRLPAHASVRAHHPAVKRYQVPRTSSVVIKLRQRFGCTAAAVQGTRWCTS